MAVVADSRALDLDKIGAQIAEKHGAKRARERFGQLNSAAAIENCVHSREYN